ncbi:hypothetical protein NHX12_028438 [Muraenolepis orangiensis]|uniref:Purinergic receptor n=1 Tax=Muraenolepis orangiensis TaxID=630683 RepID=A0A9Q0EA76_9TELE|nr:hypothetical protein NHX12_028438 [Muraenolepis orangiensis]
MGLLGFIKDYVLGFLDYETPKGFDVISTTVRREVTYDQKQGTCAEYFAVMNANCTKNSDCTAGEVIFDGNGRRTGRCVQFYDQKFKTCEIQAWCPVEEWAAVREPPLLEAINFTVFIENSIRFPQFDVTRLNTKDASNKRMRRKYLNKCHYDEEKEPYCPIFRLGYIAEQARENFAELCRTGGVIGVFINWQCDLDLDSSSCKPTYSFRLLDTRKDLPTAGYYYRFSKSYIINGVESRTLIKAYGIRLDIIVHGHAGKFSFIPTIINSVTAMGSVGVCSMICDWILLTFIDKNEVFSGKKFDDPLKDPVQPMSTAFTIVSYGSNHSDLSDGVPL